VISLWLVLVVGAVYLASATGSNYNGSNSLPGTQSATAQTLLKNASPAAAGDSEEIVFATRSGAVTAAGVRSSIDSMLAKVDRLPNVASVGSPYAAGNAAQISKDRTVAYAAVQFTKSDQSISASEATRFVNLARSVNSANLQVDVLGSVASSTNSSSQISTLLGIVAAFVVLILVLGSLLPALVPLLCAALGVVTAVSVVGALSNSISMAGFTQQLCILIGLGVGIDYALFIVSRTRTGLRQGLSVQDAVAEASATAGRAVLFAAATVCIALLGMVIVGINLLTGAGIAAAISVLFPMLASQTLVPALNGLIGRRLLNRRQRRAMATPSVSGSDISPAWERWSGRVASHKLALGGAGLAIMLALAIPASSMRLANPDYGADPTTTTTTTHRAYELMVRGFGPGFSGPLELVAPINSAAQEADFAAAVTTAGRATGVAAVTGVEVLPARAGHSAVAIAEVYPKQSPQSAQTTTLVQQLRTTIIPSALKRGNAKSRAPSVFVGGQTALAIDESTVISSKLPIFVAAVVALSFLLLMIVFRSIAIPLTAAVMNLLSAAAAFGVITAIFQNGFLGSLVGTSQTAPIQPIIPTLMFAVLFGLSMDYEVFLISRIHEEWLKTRNNTRSITVGQAANGGVITALATIMIVVFLAFVLSTDLAVKIIGVGMSVGIFLDAFLVRTLLVPAVMYQLGNRNWSFSDRLDRLLPRLNIEGSVGRHPAPISRTVAEPER
jgi:RND superfamily putative drug exporter